VVVAARKTNAPYSGPLLQTGDVIYEINRHVVSGVEALRTALSRMKSGDSVVLLVERSGHLMYIALQLD
jgi:S1-C subfamily serine protease